MSKWPMVPLRELLQLQRRWLKPEPLKTYREIGIRSFGKGIFHKAPVEGSSLGNKRVLRIEPRDLVFNNVFAWEGAVAVAGPDEVGMIGSHRFVTYTVNSTLATPQFLRLFFTTKKGLEILLKASPGSAGRNKTLGLDRFIRYSIPLPPTSEQGRIVTWFDATTARVDEARQLRKAVNSETERLWDGVSRRLLDSLGPVESRPLGELVEIIGGGTPSKQNPMYWGGHIPWFSPKDMKARELFEATDRITDAGVESSSARLLPASAVLIVIRGMILVHTVPVAVLRVPATINQDMKALVPKDGILAEYLCHALWAKNRELLQLVNRSSHDTRKLTTPKLVAFQIPVPTVDAQRRFVTEVDSFLATVSNARLTSSASSTQLEALVPSLLADVFDRGEDRA